MTVQTNCVVRSSARYWCLLRTSTCGFQRPNSSRLHRKNFIYDFIHSQAINPLEGLGYGATNHPHAETVPWVLTSDKVFDPC